jgi:D-aminopeptidase
MGIARTGATSGNGSGDLFLAFSTANPDAFGGDGAPRTARFLPNQAMNPLFTATVEATDEAILDAMIANTPMTGRDGTTVVALPHDGLREVLGRHDPF